jgi:hypothetical protein
MILADIPELLTVMEKDLYQIPTRMRRQTERMAVITAAFDSTDGDNVSPKVRKYAAMPSTGGPTM